jgi:hypothetical protein
MATILEQTSKLANVVSAILATMASVKWRFSALKGIKDRKGGVISLLSIEKALAADLKKPNVYD